MIENMCDRLSGLFPAQSESEYISIVVDKSCDFVKINS